MPSLTNFELAVVFRSTISDVRDLFHTFDLTGNGYIDLVDLKNAATMLGIPFANDHEARKIFQLINTHDDGKITEDEFVAWWNSTTRDNLKKNIGERFIRHHVTTSPKPVQ
jgi:Ca2+-binding EF-hand superfamily protein